jgi:hypothetical protein
MHYSLIDTYPEFLRFWNRVKNLPLDDQINRWATDYLASWPDLLRIQLNEYIASKTDWQQVARSRIFPFISERFNTIQIARDNLILVCESTYLRAEKVLSFRSEVVMVIYVGIGCGAGWVTTFRDKPAILFGLENIAELDWHDRKVIEVLVAHEIGHLAHYHWRSTNNLNKGKGPWWQLYEEGFAQRCESLILGRDSWHQMGNDTNWASWCQHHKKLLAKKYLDTVDSGKPVTPFFGSWHNIRGKIETGYYLGHEAVMEIENQIGSEELATIDADKVETNFKPILIRMATTD